MASPSPLDDQKQATTPLKYILVTGGVISGLGKGIVASSTGLIMKSLGYRVTGAFIYHTSNNIKPKLLKLILI